MIDMDRCYELSISVNLLWNTLSLWVNDCEPISCAILGSLLLNVCINGLGLCAYIQGDINK